MIGADRQWTSSNIWTSTPELRPHHISLHIALAAAYAEAGQLDAAARAAEELRRLHPFFELESFGEYFRDTGDRERFRAGLRKAGL